MTTYDPRLEPARTALRIGLGAAAFLAGLDKYFDVLADWPAYVSPVVTAVLPVSAGTLMHVVGVVEIVVGLAILGPWTRHASLVAAAWLVLIALTLVSSGRFFDVAVRDVEMAIAAFALSRLTKVHDTAVRERAPVGAGLANVAA